MIKIGRMLDRRSGLLRLLLVLALFTVLVFLAGIWVAVLLSAVLALLLWKVDYRFAMVVSLGLLVFCPLFLILNLQSTAIVFANWAIYLLGLAVLVQFVEYVRLSWESMQRKDEQSNED